LFRASFLFPYIRQGRTGGLSQDLGDLPTMVEGIQKISAQVKLG
jgi:hypothetical protein